MRIAFIQTAHLPSDERIAHHQVPILLERGHDVKVISTRTDFVEGVNNCFNDVGLSRKKVLLRVTSILEDFLPDLLICDTPIAVIMGGYYRKKYKNCAILYDVTEWYPSKKNLRNHTWLSILARLLLLPCLNLWAGVITQGFIYGEYYKARPFQFLFRKKKNCFLSYYPDLKYIERTSVRHIEKKCRLLYSGAMTEEKGYFNVLRALYHTATWYPQTKFELTILTGELPIQQECSDSQPENLEVLYRLYLPFEEFCKELSKYDLFLDLRSSDVENTHCLPIKLFYYMATGRPTIITSLKAIRNGVPDIDECAVLVERPFRAPEVAAEILKYVKNPNYYQTQCQNALELSEKKYNWSLIVDDFIQLVESYERH